MPVGRNVLLSAWKEMPDIVRQRLGATCPTRRVALPMLRHLFALPNRRGVQVKASDLYSATKTLGETEADVARKILSESTPMIEQLAGLYGEFWHAYPAIRRTDPFSTVIVNEYFTAAAPRGAARTPLDEQELAGVRRTLAGLLERMVASPDGDTANPPITIALLNEFYDDAERMEWLEERIVALASVTPYERRPASPGQIDQFLDAPNVQREPTARVAVSSLWAELCTTPDSFGSDGPAAVGLSEGAGAPPLVGSRHDAPTAHGDDRVAVQVMDWSVYRRAWSVARSGSGRKFAAVLPPVDEVLDRTVESFRFPYHLYEPTARAALVAGIRAYTIVPSVEPPDTKNLRGETQQAILSIHQRQMEAFPGLAKRLARDITAFFARTGGRARVGYSALNELDDLVSSATPRLWKKLHNAQFREGYLDDPANVLDLLRGAVTSIISDASERYLTGEAGAAADDEFDADLHHPRLAGAAMDGLDGVLDRAHRRARDERVRFGLSELHRRYGGDGTAEFLRRLCQLHSIGRFDDRVQERDALRAEWRAANGDSVAGVGWEDLLDYLDDHIQSWTPPSWDR